MSVENHSATPEASPLVARFRHIGLSLLPLAMFVGGALGYDTLMYTTRVVPSRPVVTAAKSGHDAVGQNRPTAAVRASVSSAPVGPAADLQDSRSLLDLNPAPVTTAVIADRLLMLQLGDAAAVALGFAGNGADQPGAYAVLRGVPQSAALSHGIAAGSGSWLIDGGEIPVLELSMRSGSPGDLPLELTVLSRDSRVLGQERVVVAVRAAQPAPRLVHIVPPSPLAMPGVAPPVDAPVGSSAQSVMASQPPVSSAATSIVTTTMPGPMRIAVSPSTNRAIDGRRSVRLAIEPTGAVPDGAYVVLRGVPERSAMSRGLSIGADVWLLTLIELGELELGVPESGPSGITLGARLVTADGRLLAEEVVRYEHGTASAAPPAADAGADTTKLALLAADAAIVTATTPQATPPPVAAAAPQAQRSAAVVTPQQQREPTLPGTRIAQQQGTTASNPASLDVPAQQATQAALLRGRKMLQSGNIAIARPLLERAAGQGSAEAAALLGASFDPGWLSRAGAVGITGDATRAAHWYAQAHRMGASDVERIVAGVIRR